MKSFELSRLQVGLCYEKPANEFFAKYTDIFSVIHFAAPKAEVLLHAVIRSLVIDAKVNVTKLKKIPEILKIIVAIFETEYADRNLKKLLSVIVGLINWYTYILIRRDNQVSFIVDEIFGFYNSGCPARACNRHMGFLQNPGPARTQEFESAKEYSTLKLNI